MTTFFNWIKTLFAKEVVCPVCNFTESERENPFARYELQQGYCGRCEARYDTLMDEFHANLEALELD